jgi:hypothetical protein
MAPKSVLITSAAGNLCAAAAGLIIYMRRGNLALGMLGCVFLQAVLGRTFLQPWYFCPLIMIAPLVGAIEVGPGKNTESQQIRGHRNALVLRFILLVGASALAGGYAIPVLARGYSPLAQTWSFIGIVVAPIVIWTGLMASARIQDWLKPNRYKREQGVS